LPPALEVAPAAASRYLQAIEDGSLVTDLAQLLRDRPASGIWLVLGPELRGGGLAPAMVELGRSLFGALHAAGYELVGGEPEIGIAHATRRP
jgi:hypothetical protein